MESATFITILVVTILVIGIFAGVIIWRDRIENDKQKIVFLEILLEDICDVLKTKLARQIIKRGNGVTMSAAFTARNFFCDCTWPIRTDQEGTEDAESPHLLRVIDGYIALTEDAVLRKWLRRLGIQDSNEVTLYFTIEEDGYADEHIRKQHGIFYNIKIEDTCGTKTLVASGILSSVVLEENKHDNLVSEIFSLLQRTN